ncbi:sigma-70 family RNA polymerase sigma factor [Conexibacter sp. W3-3-2]|nr:sigma-70 family RNA polymerase sigma factor [Conexibacter sp. W3-3-2]
MRQGSHSVRPPPHLGVGSRHPGGGRCDPGVPGTGGRAGGSCFHHPTRRRTTTVTTLLLHPTTARTATDEELVAAVRDGAHGAFEAIHARYAHALLGYARNLLGGAHHDAEECVQDAFVRALRALRADPDREITLKAWLYTIVRNACLDRLRSRTNRSTVGLDDLGALLSDRSGDPHDVLARREAVREVVAHVRALPERQRLALVRHELEGHSHVHVAASLGVTPGASKALVHRARQGVSAAAVAA